MPRNRLKRRHPAKKKSNQVKKKSFFSGSYFGFNNTRTSAEYRAQYPYQNHAWVYAAATQIATVASQATYKVYRETQETIKGRQLLEKSFGRKWTGPKAGKSRTAIMRYSRRAAGERIFKQTTSLVEDLSHPLSVLFEKPNPIQNRSAFDLTTHLWAALRGEYFWIKTGVNGAPVGPTQFPEELWPISPDCFTEKLNHRKEHVGWDVTFPNYFPSVDRRMTLEKYEVVHVITRPDPNNPLRGMSPVKSVAISVETDLLSKTHNRSLIENDAIPKGIIVNEVGWADDDTDAGMSEDDFKAKWKHFYEGELKSGRIGFLEGSMKFLPVGLSPQDMQFLEQYKVDRQEVLSAMGVPPSGVGLSEYTNYSTAMVQDSGFWNKTILPFLKAQEAAIDFSMLYNETDNIVGLYDITDIEALRAGISDKIDMAAKMCTDSLHTPPVIAFETVGLRVNRYEGDDKGFVSLALQKVEDALAAKPELEEPEEVDIENEEEEVVGLDEETKKRLRVMIYNSLKQNKPMLELHMAICQTLGLEASSTLASHCVSGVKDKMSLSEMVSFSRRSVEIFNDLKIGVDNA